MSLCEVEQRFFDAVSSCDVAAAKALFDEVEGRKDIPDNSRSLVLTADPDTEESVLMVACNWDDVDMVRLLLEKGDLWGETPNAIVNTVDHRFTSALHRAVSSLSPIDAIVLELLDAGAIVDCRFGECEVLRSGCSLLRKSTNDRLRLLYEDMYGEAEGGWPVGR